MATFLDISILKNFSIVFTWLLIYVVVFGFLEWKSPFGKDKKGFNVMVAFVIAFLGVLSSSARHFIEFVTPWFLVMAIVIFFILFIVRMFGLSDGSVENIIKDNMAHTWLIVLSIFIVLMALGASFGQQLLETGTGADPSSPTPPIGSEVPSTIDQVRTIQRGPSTSSNFGENALQIFVNPKVLGMLFILFLGTFTIYFLSKKV
ncbi:MAG: hypothetical protein AABX70_07430 [Nanoarchaeota archaeon]